MSHLPGKFTWFEHLSGDPACAKQFYQSLFGWDVHGMPRGEGTYHAIHNGIEMIGGIIDGPQGKPSHWSSAMSVADVDSSFNAATAAGATSLMAPTTIGEMGRAATIADPTGAIVTLWKGNRGDRPDVEKIAVGDWCWNELLTPDVRKSLAFYEGVFGYTHDTMHNAVAGEYFILKGPDGKPRGGVMKAPHADTPPMWMPYVLVEDADAIAARVAPLGGKLMMAPRNVPNVGRIGALVDPVGASLGFIRTVVA
ncbi:MAG TPA: VOC family protein [Ramlibacter sp.]|nr:VOC family protein [Ramlibacter sp.]